jgi:dolichol-phosphate hexosyltransferase
MYKDYLITVVIPCLNEAEGIRKVLSRIPGFVDEVIVVDNNSTDGTAEIAGAMGARVIHENVRGYGRAYKTGLLHARGDIIVTLDGDHSYPVDALSYLIEALLHSRVGFVSASRFPITDPESMSRINLWGNRFLSLAASLLFLRWIRDSQSGMWIFFKDALERMDLVSDGMAFSEEIKLEAIMKPKIGFREIPIRYSNRAGEKKLRPWRDGWANLLFLFRKRFLRSRTGMGVED